MKKISGFGAMLASLGMQTLGGKIHRGQKEPVIMLWPAWRGNYVRAKHGELKDENGNPRYA